MSTTVATTPKVVEGVVISDPVLKLSDKIAEAMQISDAGVLTVNSAVFLDNAPANVKKHIAEVHEYESLFSTAAMRAFGPTAIDHLKTHRDNKRVYGLIETGAAQIALNYTAPNGKKADGTPKDPSVTVVYRRKEHADHVAVRQEIYAKTLQLFD